MRFRWYNPDVVDARLEGSLASLYDQNVMRRGQLVMPGVTLWQRNQGKGGKGDAFALYAALNHAVDFIAYVPGRQHREHDVPEVFGFQNGAPGMYVIGNTRTNKWPEGILLPNAADNMLDELVRQLDESGELTPKLRNELAMCRHHLLSDEE